MSVATPPRCPSPTRGSFATPIVIDPKTATARRMSLSSTPQHSVLAPPSTPMNALQHPQLTLAAVLTSTMLLGMMISLVLDTSLNTSLLSHSHLPERPHFFARKSNPINQIFVKNAWGWTSLAYLLHLASSPPARTSRRSRLAVWLLATAFWVVFTTWFFGAGLGDRIIALSGGSCAVALPREWDLDPAALKPLLPSAFPEILTSTDSDQLYLPLSSSLCSSRLPLTPKTHPELFSILSSASEIFPTDTGTNTLHPTSSHPTLTLLNPRWHRGFDVSGHAFLLTMSTLVLARELIPSWRGEKQGSSGLAGGWGRWVQGAATLGGTSLVILWVWMVGMTAVWFHNPPEKLSGLSLGLGAGALINLIIPQPTSPTTFAPRTHAALARATGEDENAARRGQAIDEGVIIDEEDDEEDATPIGKGRRKEE